MQARQAVLGCLLLVLAACSSSRPDTATATLAVPGGGSLSLTLPAEVARDALASALGCELECNGALGPEAASLLGELERKGPRARASRRDPDGTLSARRSGQRLRLDYRAGDGGRVEANVPWALAECLLGRRTDLDRVLTGGRVRVRGADGDWLELRLE